MKLLIHSVGSYYGTSNVKLTSETQTQKVKTYSFKKKNNIIFMERGFIAALG